MIASLALILLCQLIGEVLARLLHLPVPGPVIGMGLLFAGLTLRGGPPQELERTARGLLSHLSLLFVPAGVGIMLHLDLILTQWKPILAALVLSTALTIGVTGFILQRFSRKKGSEP